MKTLKKALAILLTLALIMVSISGCGPAKSQPSGDKSPSPTGKPAKDVITIGASWQDLKNEYIKNLADAAESYCTAEGIELISNDGAGNPETQLSQIETFITQGVDAIILNPYDSDGCIPAAAKAKEAGIPCILVCSVLSDMSSVTSFVGSNDVTAGEMEAQLIMDTIGAKGTVVILRGPNGHSAEVNRSEGIYSVLDKNKDVTVAFDQTANWDRAEAMSLMENWIQTGTKIDAVISENDEMAVGAYNALTAAGLGDTPVVGIDGIADAYRSISEGGMLATYLQDSVGQAETAVKVAIQAVNGEKVESNYEIPFTLVHADNVADFLK